MTLPPDSKEFIELLNSAKVEYVVVVAHAMAYYGVSRITGHIDIAVRVSPTNATRICHALKLFGFGTLGLTESDFLETGRVIQLGYPPNRIDLLTSIDGVSFDELWRDRVGAQWNGVALNLISRAHLIANKRATGRAQDLADVQALEK